MKKLLHNMYYFFFTFFYTEYYITDFYLNGCNPTGVSLLVYNWGSKQEKHWDLQLPPGCVPSRLHKKK